MPVFLNDLVRVSGVPVVLSQRLVGAAKTRAEAHHAAHERLKWGKDRWNRASKVDRYFQAASEIVVAALTGETWHPYPRPRFHSPVVGELWVAHGDFLLLSPDHIRENPYAVWILVSGSGPEFVVRGQFRAGHSSFAGHFVSMGGLSGYQVFPTSLEGFVRVVREVHADAVRVEVAEWERMCEGDWTNLPRSGASCADNQPQSTTSLLSVGDPVTTPRSKGTTAT